MELVILIIGLVVLGVVLSLPPQSVSRSVVIVSQGPVARTINGGALLIVLAVLLLLALIFG